jgi:hypothetical protein
VLPETVILNDTAIIGRKFEPSEDADDYGYDVTDPEPVTAKQAFASLLIR